MLLIAVQCNHKNDYTAVACRSCSVGKQIHELENDSSRSSKDDLNNNALEHARNWLNAHDHVLIAINDKQYVSRLIESLRGC